MPLNWCVRRKSPQDRAETTAGTRPAGADRLDPEIEWSDTGRIQLNEEVTVTLTHEIDLGLFAGFGSFPITLRADATGKSEVYWK